MISSLRALIGEERSDFEGNDYRNSEPNRTEYYRVNLHSQGWRVHREHLAQCVANAFDQSARSVKEIDVATADCRRTWFGG